MGDSSAKQKCQHGDCERFAEFEVFDQNERRPDMTSALACEEHLGGIMGSVPPTEPTGPWMVYAVETSDG